MYTYAWSVGADDDDGDMHAVAIRRLPDQRVLGSDSEEPRAVWPGILTSIAVCFTLQISKLHNHE
jgi:hypothetical protein